MYYKVGVNKQEQKICMEKEWSDYSQFIDAKACAACDVELTRIMLVCYGLLHWIH